MIDGLRPYPDMRPTNLPWLGDVPSHWDVRRNGRLFGARREVGFPDLPILEVSIRSGVRVRDFGNGGRKQEIADRSKYQRAVRGDIAYNMMRMWQGAVGIAPADGLVSPAYVVARPFQDTDSAYYAYLFRTAAYMRETDVFSRGIVPDRNRLYWESFKQMPSVFPPLNEQQQIVRFLDWHGARTAKLIRAKRNLIALVHEQKRAIVRRAVTRGLDPNVKLQPSGIPWLGDVPEGWSISRVKTEFQCLNYRRIPLSSTERGNMTLRRYDYYGASGVIDKVDDFLFDDRLLLIAEDGANLVLRNLPLAIIAEGKFWVNNHAHILKPRRGDIGFLAAVLEGLNFLPWISGAAQPKLTQDRLMSIAIAVPPAEQQQQIIKSTEAATNELTLTIDAASREVALIQEFRTRLIADSVTGKLDVRSMADSLPAIFDEEPLDELADGDDLEETIDEIENEEVAA
jgi:type I restriction enzyme, S subunit